MIDAEKFARLPERKRQEILSEIMLNAYGWYSDARKIIQSGSFGHGAALLVVAREEVAKVLALSNDPSHSINLKDHKQKLGLLKLQTFGRNPLMDQFQLILRNAKRLPQPISAEQARSAIDEANKEYLSILMDDPSKKEEYAKMRYRYAVRQDFDKIGIRLREGGLYVNVKDNGEYESPSEVEEGTTLALLDVALEDIYWTDQLWNDGKLSGDFGLDTPYRIA